MKQIFIFFHLFLLTCSASFSARYENGQIYDLNGSLIKEYKINQLGSGSIVIDAGAISPGAYVYTLVVDNEQVDAKQMVITK